MKWAEITREERFFTATLYHDVKNNTKPLYELFRKKLGSRISSAERIVDYGFEVCFFRDAVKAGIIPSRYLEQEKKTREKQTFDLVFTLSDKSLIIVEAKAQQSFSTKQLNELRKARDIIANIPEWPYKPVYLGALYSSIYTPRDTTLEYFDIKITWEEIRVAYLENELIYQRANNIHRK